MKTAELRQQVQAITSLGIPQQQAIAMIARGEARRLRKSLPPINDPLPTAPNREIGKWSKKSDAANDRGKVALSQDEKDSLTKIRRKKTMLKLKPRKAGDKRPTSPFVKIIEKLDGTKWMSVIGMDGKLTIKQLDKYFVPTFVETQAGKPDTTKDKEEDTTMKKSTRLEKLIARAKADPSKLQTQTIQALNQHLVSQGKEPIIKPIPHRSWFRQQTLAEIGADRDARAAHMPPVAPVKMPSLKDAKMSTAEIQQYRLELALKQEAAQKG